jgi:hypothetical protein
MHMCSLAICWISSRFIKGLRVPPLHNRVFLSAQTQHPRYHTMSLFLDLRCLPFIHPLIYHSSPSAGSQFLIDPAFKYKNQRWSNVSSHSSIYTSMSCVTCAGVVFVGMKDGQTSQTQLVPQWAPCESPNILGMI